MRSLAPLVPALFLSFSAHTSPLLAQDTTRVSIEGTVIDSRSGLPIEGVEVTVVELDVEILTDSIGVFSLPDLPLGTFHLALQRSAYERAEGPLQVLRPGSMVIRLDPLAASIDPGSSRIVGSVKDAGSEKPLEGALVSIEGVPLNQVTGPDGRFVLSDVPPGTRRLSVSLLGYSKRTDSITIPPASLLSLDVELTVDPIRLAPISVSVERRNLSLELAGFYGRRQATSGIFLTGEEVEFKQPLSTADIFRSLPGVRVTGSFGLDKAVFLRAGLRPTTGRIG
ncbi:carboxypeptidase regulatory-like domain-containing protein, partial [Gemmatimonadota bacterium]